MRLIDADALRSKFVHHSVYSYALNRDVVKRVLFEEDLDNAPTIETDMSEYSDKLWQKAYERGKAEGRPTGHWIKHISNIECSNCGEKFYCEEDENCQDYEPCNDFLFNFCPNCGAKMTKEAENETDN